MDRKQGSPHQSEGQQFAHCRGHFSEVNPDYNKNVLSNRSSCIVCTSRKVSDGSNFNSGD